jgi:hypothetical protein
LGSGLRSEFRRQKIEDRRQKKRLRPERGA